MMRRLGLFLTLALAVSTVCANSEEVVTVQLEPPMDSARRDAAEQMLRLDYPRYRALWEQQQSKVESFVVARSAGLRIEGLCDGVPIRVAIRNGKVTTATYAETAGDCIAGRAVEPREYFWPIPSPGQLFDWILELGSPPSGSRLYGCLLATFDAATGIPTRIDSGCPTHVDDFFTVEVSDIRATK
jgi:hypothetical protein